MVIWYGSPRKLICQQKLDWIWTSLTCWLMLLQLKILIRVKMQKIFCRLLSVLYRSLEGECDVWHFLGSHRANIADVECNLDSSLPRAALITTARAAGSQTQVSFWK